MFGAAVPLSWGLRCYGDGELVAWIIVEIFDNLIDFFGLLAGLWNWWLRLIVNVLTDTYLNWITHRWSALFIPNLFPVWCMMFEPLRSKQSGI